MKYWKCLNCAWEKETPDNIIFVACNCCLTEMKEYPDMRQFKVEVKGDGRSRIAPD
ncbi:unnamed protein product [marine sediment metagenome]|uniref:Uncharacterized protein n=1 Tax=marine sediment metagenome TaxID=412755 RepID=X0V9F3_9ZZZZ